jgi:hypothetical protein
VQLHWRGTTRYHDWFDRTIPRRMLERARALNLIGDVEWFSVGPDDVRQEIGRDDGVLDRLLDHKPKRGASHRFSAGGSRPHPWEMALLLMPYLAGERVQGYNTLNLWFPAEAFPGTAGSDALVRALREIHTQEDTEFAFIHPYERWSQLTDTLAGPYGRPLTIAPMFAGVFWATFLGRGHLADFDVDKLRDLQAYELQWLGENGLFLRVCADVRDAVTADVEQQMLRLTETFRRARR